MRRKNLIYLAAFLSYAIFLTFKPAALAEMRQSSQATSRIESAGFSVVDGVIATKDRALQLMNNLTHTQSSRPLFTHVPGKLIVKLKTGMSPEHISFLKAKHGLTLQENKQPNQFHPFFRKIYYVSADAKADLDLISSELMSNKAVEYAEPIAVKYTQMVPNDPMYTQQWSHIKTEAEMGWNITTGNSSIIIAVIDTGVDYNHPDLTSNIWRDAQGNPGRDFVNITPSDYTSKGYQLIASEDYQTADSDPSDYYGHGTHVAGIISATGNNGIGVTGVCPGCRIMPVRAGFAIRYGGYDYGTLQSDNIADAIIYAADNGAKIINMSFGGPFSQLEKDAIDYAYSKGVVLIASAGNSNVSYTDYSYPASHSNVLSVAATDYNDSKAGYSNYGAWVGVAAPGGWTYSILSTVPTSGSLGDLSGYRCLTGTSMAAPYVAGLAGLILSRNPNLSNREVMQTIQQGVDLFNVDLPNSQYYIGAGRVNVHKSLRIASVSSATIDITSPLPGFATGENITVSGSSSVPYRVLYGQGIYPASWAEFGSGPAMSGILAVLNSSTLPAAFDDYTIKLVAEDSEGKTEKIVQGQIGKHFLPGWPQMYSFSGSTVAVWNAPTLADIDNDGFDEIIITGRDKFGNGLISVFKKNGTAAAGNWPLSVPGPLDFGAVAGDINGDGHMEICATVLPTYGIKCWDRLGNLLWTTVPEPGNSTLNITLADINGDGKLEIITQAYKSRVYVLNHTGAILWSYLPNEYDSWDVEKIMAVADFDGNGKKQIVKNVITNIKFDPGDTYRTLGGSLLVLNHDSTLRWKHDWPEPGEPLSDIKYYTIYPNGSPVAADINKDGKPEIMVKVSVWKMTTSGANTSATRFYAFDFTGNVLPGWPVEVSGGPSYAELAVGDLDLDGYPELVGAAGGYIYAITKTGAFLFQPVPVQAWSNLTIADITGDGFPDILVSDGTRLKVIERDGTVSTLPIKIRDGATNVHNTPIVTDLDQNGTADLIFLEWKNRNIIWAWDLKVPYVPQAAQFAQFGANAHHSNSYSPPSNSSIIITTPPSLPVGDYGSTYSLTLGAYGGNAPYHWSLINGSLPIGLTLNSTTGELSGLPTFPGSSTFTISATDTLAASASKTFTLQIYSPVAITTTSLPDATLDAAYFQSLAATGGVPPYTWSIYSGSLPGMMSLNSSTGAIAGIPSASGNYAFIVGVTDQTGAETTKYLTISVALPAAMVVKNPLLYYNLIQDAYDIADSGNIIKLRSSAFNEKVFFDRTITIHLQGGYDNNFGASSGYTLINGFLSISRGSVKVESIIIK